MTADRFPPEVVPMKGLAILANVEASLEDLATVLRIVGLADHADRLDTIRLELRVLRLQRARRVENQEV